jgi:hypothetical protein
MKTAALGMLPSLLILLSISSALGPASAQAGYAVTVKPMGLPSAYSAQIYVDGARVGEVVGGGSYVLNLTGERQVSVDPYVPSKSGDRGMRYYCPQNVLLVSGSSDLKFFYKRQFHLEVRSERGAAEGGGWYDEGETATARVTSKTVAGGSGDERYVFVGWGGDATGLEERSNPIRMDGPKTAVANWRRQLALRVSAIPSNLSYLDSVRWYDEGARGEFAAPPAIGAGPNARYAFKYWSGDFIGSSPNGTLLMDGPKHLVANYKLQYLLEVKARPDLIEKAIEIRRSDWYDAGSAVAMAPPKSPMDWERGTRFLFDGWVLDGKNVGREALRIEMDSPHLLEVVYKTQYYLSIETEYGRAKGDGWYDAGSTANFSVEGEVGGWLVKYVFQRWSGDFSGETASGVLTMDRPKLIRAVWRADYTGLVVLLAIAMAASIAIFSVLLLYLKRGLGPRWGPRGPKAIPAAPEAVAPVPQAVLRPCPKCGARIPPDAKYCDKCGEMVEGAKAARDVDGDVYRYLLDRGGAISWTEASEDLGLPIDTIKASIERLKRSGRIEQGP